MIAIIKPNSETVLNWLRSAFRHAREVGRREKTRKVNHGFSFITTVGEQRNRAKTQLCHSLMSGDALANGARERKAPQVTVSQVCEGLRKRQVTQSSRDSQSSRGSRHLATGCRPSGAKDAIGLTQGSRGSRHLATGCRPSGGSIDRRRVVSTFLGLTPPEPRFAKLHSFSFRDETRSACRVASRERAIDSTAASSTQVVGSRPQSGRRRFSSFGIQPGEPLLYIGERMLEKCCRSAR
jgi:hypothetical protein